MRHPTRFLSLLGAAVVLVAAPTLHAQSWETIVDLSDPNSSPVGYAIMLDPFSVDPVLPDLFIGGQSAYGSVLHMDQSTDPVTLSLSDPGSGSVRRLAQDSLGNLYSAGNGWQVRRSTDGGVYWTPVDDSVVWNSSGNSIVEGLATDWNDDVFASGSDFDKRGNKYWVIRKGANKGQNWTTSYRSAKPQAEGGGVVFVKPVPEGHAGGLFAVGSLTLKRTTQWTVLRSRDSGASWQSVYAWGTSTANARTLARAITADADGNIYVAGYGWLDGAIARSWLVSRSRDGGQTWESILQYPEPQLTAAGDYNVADDIAADPAGNVYVVGRIQNKPAGVKWTVRRWDAASGEWDIWPDTLRHPMSSIPSSVSSARGVTTDAQGGVYVTGSVDGHWVVQWLVP